jgi:hypothetical protein
MKNQIINVWGHCSSRLKHPDIKVAYQDKEVWVPAGYFNFPLTMLSCRLPPDSSKAY